MAFFIEPLEIRTLFSAAPAGFEAAYQALIHDNAVLKADMKTYTAALTRDVKAVAAQLKGGGHSLADNRAAVQIVKDAALTASANSTITSKFVTFSNGVFHKTLLAEAAFSAKPSLANGHKLVAQVSACTALENAFTNPLFSAAILKASDAAVALGDAVALLPATEPTSQALFTGVQTVNTDISNLDFIQGDAGDAVLAAIPALLNGE